MASKFDMERVVDKECNLYIPKNRSVSNTFKLGSFQIVVIDYRNDNLTYDEGFYKKNYYFFNKNWWDETEYYPPFKCYLRKVYCCCYCQTECYDTGTCYGNDNGDHSFYYNDEYSYVFKDSNTDENILKFEIEDGNINTTLFKEMPDEDLESELLK